MTRPRIALCYRADDPHAGDVFSRIVPYGVFTIHGTLRAAGYDSRLFNFTGRSEREIAKTFAALDPDIVGVSHFTFNHLSAVMLYRVAAEVVPRALRIGGGPQATHLDGRVLAAENGAPHVIVRGEGEGPMLAITRAVAEGSREWAGIDGLSWLADGQPQRSKAATTAENLDAYHTDDRFEAITGVDPNEQYPIVITSRGCPATCTFCNTPLYWGRQMRFRSAANVAQEIEFIQRRYGITYFSIRDDTFTARKSRVREFCEELLRRRIFVLWNCQSRVNLVDRERLTWLKSAGCDQMQFGVESNSPEILEELDKAIRPDQIERALSLARQIGIKTSAYFITGIPGQNDEDLRRNLTLFETAGLMDGIVAPLAYYPGTRLYDEAKERGEVDEDVLLAGAVDELMVRTDPHASRDFAFMVDGIAEASARNAFTREEVQRHLEESGRTWSALLDWGVMEEQAGRADGARRAYAEIVERWPDSPWGYLALARLAERLGERQEAKAWSKAAGQAARRLPVDLPLPPLRPETPRGTRPTVPRRRSRVR